MPETDREDEMYPTNDPAATVLVAQYRIAEHLVSAAERQAARRARTPRRGEAARRATTRHTFSRFARAAASAVGQ